MTHIHNYKPSIHINNDCWICNCECGKRILKYIKSNDTKEIRMGRWKNG